MFEGLRSGCTLGDLLIRAIDRGGDRIAFSSTTAVTTYREFGRVLSRIMQALEYVGLRRGDAIATISKNRAEAFYVNAAANLLGLRFTPMHPLGSEADHCYIAGDAKLHALVHDAAFAQRAINIANQVPGLRTIALDFEAGEGSLLELAERFDPQPLVARASGDEIASVSYTGGTTGRPKGVMLSHRARVMMTYAQLAEWDWAHETRYLAMTPISHAAGSIITPVLVRGGTVFIEEGFDPARFLSIVHDQRITTTFLVPTMIYKLLDHPGLTREMVSSLEVVIYGASAISPSRLTEAIDRIGPVFMQLYGQSEAPNCVTALRRADHDPVRAPQRLASCGRLIGPNRVVLLGDDGQEVADGAVGEICVRGPMVMDGYLNKPEETAKAFEGGWLHTGDMARRDKDGFYYIVDRVKDMIVSGGFNVFPREVEDELAAHPAVAAAAVIGVPDDTWGESVKAVVVLRAGASASAAELIAHVRERKGPVQAPKSIDFVEALPVTSLGKPDKKALRAPYWKGATRNIG